MSAKREVTHVFLDAANPSYDMALPLLVPFTIEKTEVVVTSTKQSSGLDAVMFTHYVRRNDRMLKDVVENGHDS